MSLQGAAVKQYKLSKLKISRYIVFIVSKNNT